MIAVAMSIVSERYYYRWRVADGPDVRWIPLVLANVFSSLVLLLLPTVTLAIKEILPDLELGLGSFQNALLWGSVSGCGVLFLASFIVPHLLRGPTALPKPVLHLAGDAS